MEYFLTDEQKMIKELAAKIADEKIAPVALQYDEAGKFPHDIVKVLADSDLCGVYIPSLTVNILQLAILKLNYQGFLVSILIHKYIAIHCEPFYVTCVSLLFYGV